MIYDGVYFFKTKSNEYAGNHELRYNWHYSGRQGSFEDCKKFWRTSGDTDNRSGFIRSWEQKKIVSKDEYCKAKYFHNWFGFGNRKNIYCGASSSNNSSSSSSSNNSSSSSSTKIDLSWSNDRTICNNATSREGFWNYSGKMIREYREEAESRNLSLEDCNKLTGRGKSKAQTEEKEGSIIEQKLKKLKKLLSDDLITQEDYDKKKAEYLENF